jgi:ribosomal protein S18 acetylase RimI-like enzyme
VKGEKKSMTSESALIRLGMNDIDWATDLLTEAFLNEPPVPQLFHEPLRREQASYFMKCSCAYALLFGECHSTSQRDGVALWLLPGKTAMTPGRMYQAGMLSAPFRLGLSAFSRFMGFAGHTDKFHKQAAPMPHYYLFALGVKPSAQGKGVGGLLLKNMLERIDREKMSSYLETQKESNVGLYQKYGFEVAAHGAFPKLKGLENWGMFRKVGA